MHKLADPVSAGPEQLRRLADAVRKLRELEAAHYAAGLHLCHMVREAMAHKQVIRFDKGDLAFTRVEALRRDGDDLIAIMSGEDAVPVVDGSTSVDHLVLAAAAAVLLEDQTKEN